MEGRRAGDQPRHAGEVPASGGGDRAARGGGVAGRDPGEESPQPEADQGAGGQGGREPRGALRGGEEARHRRPVPDDEGRTGPGAAAALTRAAGRASARPAGTRPQPRAIQGILDAAMVTNWIFASSGRFAIIRMVLPTCLTSMVGSTLISPFACLTPFAMRAVIGVAALPISIWPETMSKGRPSSASVLVRPVMACLVEV